MKKLLGVFSVFFMCSFGFVMGAEKHDPKEKIVIRDKIITCPLAKSIIIASSEEISKMKQKDLQHIEAFVTTENELVINITKLEQMPFGAAMFVINHECGHIVNETYGLPNSEINADLYATYIGVLNQSLDVDTVAAICKNLKDDTNGKSRCAAIKHNQTKMFYELEAKK